jgi:uncharacterized membrane protein YkvA (DUF1232 family)
MPFDLIPDFIPVAGEADDAIVAGFVLRRLVGEPNRRYSARSGPGLGVLSGSSSSSPERDKRAYRKTRAACQLTRLGCTSNT